MPLRGGRRIAAGRLLRSEDFVGLTGRDVRALDALGVRLVCDLRSPGERSRRPGAWPEGAVDVLELEGLDAGRAMSAARFRAILADDTGRAAEAYMREVYAALPSIVAPGLAELLRRIADLGEAPVLVHCTAGKDRTGVVVALLLLALGAAPQAVVAEYLRSDEHYGAARVLELMLEIAEWDADRPPSPAAIDALRVRPAYLEVALRAIDAGFGTLDRYFEAAGLDEVRRARLREALTEPAPSGPRAGSHS